MFQRKQLRSCLRGKERGREKELICGSGGSSAMVVVSHLLPKIKWRSVISMLCSIQNQLPKNYSCVVCMSVRRRITTSS